MVFLGIAMIKSTLHKKDRGGDLSGSQRSSKEKEESNYVAIMSVFSPFSF